MSPPCVCGRALGLVKRASGDILGGRGSTFPRNDGGARPNMTRTRFPSLPLRGRAECRVWRRRRPSQPVRGTQPCCSELGRSRRLTSAGGACARRPQWVPPRPGARSTAGSVSAFASALPTRASAFTPQKPPPAAAWRGCRRAAFAMHPFAAVTRCFAIGKALPGKFLAAVARCQLAEEFARPVPTLQAVRLPPRRHRIR